MARPESIGSGNLSLNEIQPDPFMARDEESVISETISSRLAQNQLSRLDHNAYTQGSRPSRPPIECRDMHQPPPYNQLPGTVPINHDRAGPPPSYEEVVNPDVPPPSYQSLFGQVREARKTANGLADFLRKMVIIVLGTIGFTMLLGFTVFIPFTMIMMGSSYMDECPAENIPTFLLVGGVVWILKNVLNFWSNCRRRSVTHLNLEAEAELQARQKRQESWLNCFLFGWFIAGCVLVYRIYPPDYDNRASPFYCDRNLYLFAFWLVTATFIIFGLFMTCLCCLMVFSVVTNNQEVVLTSA